MPGGGEVHEVQREVHLPPQLQPAARKATTAGVTIPGRTRSRSRYAVASSGITRSPARYGFWNGSTSIALPYAWADQVVAPRVGRQTKPAVVLPSPVGGAASSAGLVTRIRSIGKPSAKSRRNTVTTASATSRCTSSSPVCGRPSKPRKPTAT